MIQYGTVKSIAVLLALLTSFAIFGQRCYQLLWVNMRRGQPTQPFGQWGKRIKGLFVFVAGQLRLFRFKISGIAHFFIFWGFLFLSLTILQAMIEGLLAFSRPSFILPIIGTFGPLALFQDLFITFVALAVLYDLYMRIVVNPERYKGSHKKQGVTVLIFILTIMLSLLVMNAIRINLREDPISAWRPVSGAISVIFNGINGNSQRVIGEVAYWIHLGVVLIFLTELPGGKHFHVVTSSFAVLLRNLDHPGELPPASEVDGNVGVMKMEQFRWRQMLDFYSCTECGRCQEVCPAYNSGLALSPKLLMLSLRDNLMRRGIALSQHSSNGISDKIINWRCYF